MRKVSNKDLHDGSDGLCDSAHHSCRDAGSQYQIFTLIRPGPPLVIGGPEWGDAGCHRGGKIIVDSYGGYRPPRWRARFFWARIPPRLIASACLHGRGYIRQEHCFRGNWRVRRKCKLGRTRSVSREAGFRYGRCVWDRGIFRKGGVSTAAGALRIFSA